jgi:hypothetical protein
MQGTADSDDHLRDIVTIFAFYFWLFQSLQGYYQLPSVHPGGTALRGEVHHCPAL